MPEALSCQLRKIFRNRGKEETFFALGHSYKQNSNTNTCMAGRVEPPLKDTTDLKRSQDFLS